MVRKKPGKHNIAMSSLQDKPEIQTTAAHEPLLLTFRGLKGRIGIFGGSFDPVHNGHISAARKAMLLHRLDAVVFIPARQNPLKKNAPICSDSQRLEMLVKGLSNETGLYVSPLELNRDDASYTITTLRHIASEVDPGSSLFLIVGADCLPEFHKWKEFDSLLSLASLLPVGRPESEGQTVILGQGTHSAILEARNKNLVPLSLDISSRSIRAQASRGSLDKSLLPETVADLIIKNNYYK